MTTYRIDGFNRQNHAERVTILLDADDNDLLREYMRRKAAEIAGPQNSASTCLRTCLFPFPTIAKGFSSGATKSSTHAFPH